MHTKQVNPCLCPLVFSKTTICRIYIYIYVYIYILCKYIYAELNRPILSRNVAVQLSYAIQVASLQGHETVVSKQLEWKAPREQVHSTTGAESTSDDLTPQGQCNLQLGASW